MNQAISPEEKNANQKKYFVEQQEIDSDEEAGKHMQPVNNFDFEEFSSIL